jgi:hypothetical protein
MLFGDSESKGDDNGDGDGDGGSKRDKEAEEGPYNTRFVDYFATFEVTAITSDGW